MSCRTSDRAGHDTHRLKPESAAPIIPFSSIAELSNNIIQKGLEFDRDWSGTGALARPEILPRRLQGRGGALVVRRDAAIKRNGGSR
jgi:hypothetical protein